MTQEVEMGLREREREVKMGKNKGGVKKMEMY